MPDTLPTDDLPLRSDFAGTRESWERSGLWQHALRMHEALTSLRARLTLPDDREAVADALDSLRGVFAALRDVGTEDPRAADDPDGTRTVVTLGDVLPE